jgi:large subunit ribosomal protein L25
MAANKTLAATTRTGTGKGAARSIRRENRVPAVIYGGGEAAQPISLDYKTINQLIYAGHFLTTIFDIDLGDGKVERVIPRDYQLDVVRDTPLHVDFLRLKPGSTLRINVPVHVVGAEVSPGVKIGGTLNVVLHTIELRVPADNIPEAITADVTPDDVVVLFLAGHGMIDTARRTGYSYLCHDATFDDVGGEAVPSESTTIAWSDFQPLAALPCRKLVFVDTCHAGGLAPSKRASAIRDFQENMMLVLAASADDETSQESDAWGHGAFTKVLLEALEGAADTRGARTNPDTGAERGDGIVSVDEVVEHVIAGVPRLTGDGRAGQHPTVSPDSLVPYVTLPLTRP